MFWFPILAGIALGAGVGFGVGAGFDLGGQVLSGQAINWGSVLVSGIEGAFSGGAGSLAANIYKFTGKQLLRAGAIAFGANVATGTAWDLRVNGMDFGGALFGNTAGELLGEAIGPVASFLAGTGIGRRLLGRSAADAGTAGLSAAASTGRVRMARPSDMEGGVSLLKRRAWYGASESGITYPKFGEIPAGALGEGRSRNRPPVPRRTERGKEIAVAGIYEFRHLKRGNLPYVGQSDNLYLRLEAHFSVGNFKNWDDVVWTEIGSEKSTILRLAEETRLRQVSEEFGGVEFTANSRNDLGIPIARPFPFGAPSNNRFARTWAQGAWKSITPWPKWLRPPN